jgi:hypothetical protein
VQVYALHYVSRYSGCVLTTIGSVEGMLPERL